MTALFRTSSLIFYRWRRIRPPGSLIIERNNDQKSLRGFTTTTLPRQKRHYHHHHQGRQHYKLVSIVLRCHKSHSELSNKFLTWHQMATCHEKSRLLCPFFFKRASRETYSVGGWQYLCMPEKTAWGLTLIISRLGPLKLMSFDLLQAYIKPSEARFDLKYCVFV